MTILTKVYANWRRERDAAVHLSTSPIDEDRHKHSRCETCHAKFCRAAQDGDVPTVTELQSMKMLLSDSLSKSFHLLPISFMSPYITACKMWLCNPIVSIVCPHARPQIATEIGCCLQDPGFCPIINPHSQACRHARFTALISPLHAGYRVHFRVLAS